MVSVSVSPPARSQAAPYRRSPVDRMSLPQHLRFVTRFAEARWPLKVVLSVLGLYLVFGLMVALAWVGLGRQAKDQVVDLAEGVTEIVSIFLVPLLLVGLIAVPFHRWVTRRVIAFTSAQEGKRPKA